MEKDKDEEERMSDAEGKAVLQLAATYIEQQKEATTVELIIKNCKILLIKNNRRQCP